MAFIIGKELGNPCSIPEQNCSIDVVAEIFLQPRQSSPTCVAWCRVFLADQLSSSSTTSSRHLMEASELSVRPCEKMNGSIMSPLLVTTADTMTGCLFFININTSYWDRVSQSCSVSSPPDLGRNFSRQKKSKVYSIGGDD